MSRARRLAPDAMFAENEESGADYPIFADIVTKPHSSPNSRLSPLNSPSPTRRSTVEAPLPPHEAPIQARSGSGSSRKGRKRS